MGMYHTDQYLPPKGEYATVTAADGTSWYQQYAADAVERKPYQAPDGSVAYHEKIVKSCLIRRNERIVSDGRRETGKYTGERAQAAQMVRGAVKVGKAVAGAAKGAAAGPYGAVAGLLWESRRGIAKAAVIAVALLLLPVMFLLTLPPLVFGGFEEAYSPADPDSPVLNSNNAI